MKKILLIQSRRTPKKSNAEHERFMRTLGRRAHIEIVSSTDVTQDWQSPATLVESHDVVLIGGSSDFFFDGGRDESHPERTGSWDVLERLRPTISYLLEKAIPTMGVCFGHQIISAIHDGKVMHDHAQRKMGTYQVALTESGKEDPLFRHLPEKFDAQYAHRDAVTTAPNGSVLLAQSPTCRFSALRFGPSMYTVQFHPELAAADLLANAEAINEYLKEGQSIHEVVRESQVASMILPLFLDEVVKR
jgi:GMP synthase-like glutamine amidotransferase